MHTSLTFSFQFFFFFFFFFWTVCFTKIFIELAVKQVQFEHVNNWIFLFPGRGDESDGVEFKIDENKNLPKLRSCKTKPTRCIQNNERTQRKFVQQWGVCQPCSGVSWMRSSCTVVIHSFFFFFRRRSASVLFSQVALQFCVHRFSPSLDETLRHLEPGVNKKVS